MRWRLGTVCDSLENFWNHCHVCSKSPWGGISPLNQRQLEEWLRFRQCKNSSPEPRGRLTGRQSISCQPLCVSRVFGSYFKFRQKRAERLPGKQCSTGTDLAPCLYLHKNSLLACWIEVGPISCSDKVRCLWLRSIIASFSSLSIYHHHLPLLNLPSRLLCSACEGTVACEELNSTIAADRVGIKPEFPTCQRFTDKHAKTVTIYGQR